MNAVRTENGIVVGTSGNKYSCRNPLGRYLIDRFDDTVSELARQTKPKTILEVGCGEGHIVELLLGATDASIRAVDISQSVLNDARRTISSDRVDFRAADMLELEPLRPAPDLVVCCEVLEHLTDPHRGLEALHRQAARWYLLSVPREPIWRVMNMFRGAYLKDFGNSPGHLQHWSHHAFLDFVRPLFETVTVRAPFPWTVVLCRRHDRSA